MWLILFFGLGGVLVYFLATYEPSRFKRAKTIALYENGMAIQYNRSRWYHNPDFKLRLSRSESLQLDEKAQPYICRKSPHTTASFPLFILHGSQAVRLTTRQPIVKLMKKITKKEDVDDENLYDDGHDVRIEPLISPQDISAQSERSSLKALMSGSITKTTIFMLIMGLVFGAILGLWASQYMPPPTALTPGPSGPGVTVVP